jgi:hypothetical protein
VIIAGAAALQAAEDVHANNLAVDGTSSVTGNATFSGALSVTGNTTLGTTTTGNLSATLLIASGGTLTGGANQTLLSAISTGGSYSSNLLDLQQSGTGNSGNYNYIRAYDVSNGAARFVVRGNGNVGIGTPSPTASLDVATTDNQGLLRAVSTSGSYSSNLLDLQQSGAGGNGSYNYIRAYDVSNGLPRFVVHGDGNVGIGTATPDSKLTLSQTDTGSNPGIKTMLSLTASNDQAFAPQNSGAKLLLQSAYSSGSTIYSSAAIYQQSQDPAVDQGGQLRFQTSNGSGALTDAMTINKLGYVGIGTATPNAGLMVFGAGQTSSAMTTDSGNLGATIVVNDSSAEPGSGGSIIFGANNGTPRRFAAIKGMFTNGGSNGQGDIAFSVRPTATDATLTEAMRIDYAGRVGIGTPTPQATLDVNGTIRADTLQLGGSGEYSMIVSPNSPAYGMGWRVPSTGGWSRGFRFIRPDNGGYLGGFGAVGGGYTLGRLWLGVDYNQSWMDVSASGTSISLGTASTSPSTGALIVAGGAGVGGDVNIGGTLKAANVNVTGNLTAPNLTAQNGSITGSSDSGLTLNAGASDKNINLTTTGTGKVGINTARFEVASTTARKISTEIPTGEPDYSYYYLKLFEVPTGESNNTIVIDGKIAGYRGNDLGVSASSRLYVSRGYASNIFIAQTVEKLGYEPFHVVQVTHGGKNWVTLLYDAHIGAGIASWYLDVVIYNTAGDSALSLEPIQSAQPLHTALANVNVN